MLLTLTHHEQHRFQRQEAVPALVKVLALFLTLAVVAVPAVPTPAADQDMQTAVGHASHSSGHAQEMDENLDMSSHDMHDTPSHDMASHDMAAQESAGHDMSMHHTADHEMSGNGRPPADSTSDAHTGHDQHAEHGHDMHAGDEMSDQEGRVDVVTGEPLESGGHEGHTGHDHDAMTAEVESQDENLFKSVGLDEKLGQKVPLDVTFKDSSGKSVTLSELVDRPTLLQLVFYHCPQTCNMMMSSLANALPGVTFTPGQDYRAVTISFDHEDTPQIARDTKANYMNILPSDFPADQWRFLTGDIPAIKAVTEAVGFRFKRVGQHNYVHPNVLIVLGEDGKVIRYLYGVDYLPFDVSMALTEAARGTPAVSIKKLVSFCFDYDPEGKKYVFNTFRVAGIALLLGLGLFFFAVLRKGNKG